MREQLGSTVSGEEGPVSYREQSTARLLERLRSTRRFFSHKVYRFVVKKPLMVRQSSSEQPQAHNYAIAKGELQPKHQQSVDESYRTPARKLITEFKVASTAATAQPVFDVLKEHHSPQFIGIKHDRYSKKVYYFLPRTLRPRVNRRGRWEYLRRM